MIWLWQSCRLVARQNTLLNCLCPTLSAISDTSKPKLAPSQCVGQLSFMGKLVLEWYLHLHVAQAAFQKLGSTGGRSVGFIMHPLMSTLLHSGKIISSQSFQTECFQPSMAVSGDVCISSTCINSFSVVQVSSGTCHKSIKTSYSSGTMLDGGSLASHSSQHVERHSSLVSHCKRYHHRWVL